MMSSLPLKEITGATKFPYLPLTEKGSIRIVHLLPALKAGRIQCYLEEVEMDDGLYNCLSYTWGKGTDLYEILLNDQIFMVRKNLYDFLDVARERPTHPVWIDAISINQHDVHEKNAQVMQMGEIYRNADVVIAWLGNCPDLDPIVHADLGLHDEWKRRELDYDGDEEEEDEMLHDAPRRLPIGFDRREEMVTIFEAIGKLGSNVYLTRAWIIQELALAGAVILWTTNGEIWRQRLGSLIAIFCDGLEYWEDICTNHPRAKSILEAMDSIRSTSIRLLINSGEAAFDAAERMDFLFDTSLECDDPRDRLYSLRAILPGGEDFVVDYTEDLVSFFYRTCNHFNFWWTDRDLQLRKILGITMEMLQSNDFCVASIPIKPAPTIVDSSWLRPHGAIIRCQSCLNSLESATDALYLYQSRASDLLASSNTSKSDQCDRIGCLSFGPVDNRTHGHVYLCEGKDGHYTVSSGWWATSRKLSDDLCNFVTIGHLDSPPTFVEEQELTQKPVKYPQSVEERRDFKLKTLRKTKTFRLALSRSDMLKRLSYPWIPYDSERDTVWMIKRSEADHARLKELRQLDPDDDGSWALWKLSDVIENPVHVLSRVV